MLSEHESPNGKYVASVFERNCGATTPYVQVVAMRTSENTFDPEMYDDWVFTIHGRTELKVSWVEDGKLSIDYSGTGDQPTQREKWRDVVVSYD